jgi:hypothetical protein
MTHEIERKARRRGSIAERKANIEEKRRRRDKTVWHVQDCACTRQDVE